MRRLVILLALVFAASLFSAPAISATSCPSKSKKWTKTSIHKTYRSHAKRTKTSMRCRRVTRCYPVKRSRAARAGAGPAVRPTVTCPTPVINVPQSAAPIVNVPGQPAPVVNVASPPPSTAVTVDSSQVYIIRDNNLLILDKTTLCLKGKVSLDTFQSAPTMSPPTATPPCD